MNYLYETRKHKSINLLDCKFENSITDLHELKKRFQLNRVFRNLTFMISLFVMMISTAAAQGPLSVSLDPLCSTNCCSSNAPCSCSAGVLVTGGLPPAPRSRRRNLHHSSGFSASPSSQRDQAPNAAPRPIATKFSAER